MCQNRRRLDPIIPPREHKGIQQPQLHIQSSSQADAQNGTLLRHGAASDLQKRNALINSSQSAFVPNSMVVPQPALPPHGASHL